ncbi:glycosyltransferase family 2 protein, partial [Helicobacter pullorum]|uniref:glycosyltransferase family 2 protein n=1 Tax=Helicobacter pullorum TaxID=35818 RepID=UPI000A9909F2
MKKVGIIIPIYNVQNYLKECLESVINQTYKNLEIVLINDGSTDNSINIAKEYARKDSRIVLFSKENEGQSVARNIGIEYFKKHYSFFSKPHKAQKEHSLIEFEVSKKEGGGGLYNY